MLIATIPATGGEPYEIHAMGKLLRLERLCRRGRARMVFAPADVYAVCNALTDLAEELDTR
ncbi:hypothetical protein QN239_26840 [Mycolicibacterium sp. Y3]